MAKSSSSAENARNLPLPALLSVQEAAPLIKLGVSTIYRLAAEDPDVLPPVTRLWGRVLFRADQVEAWRRNPPPQRPSMRGKWKRPPKVKVLKDGPGRPTNEQQKVAREAAAAVAIGGAA